MAIVTRDYTGLFEKFRRSYRAAIVQARPKTKAVFENEIYESIADEVHDDGIEMNTFVPALTVEERAWLNEKAQLDKFLQDINRAIEGLRDDYRKVMEIQWSRGSKEPSSGTRSIAPFLFTQITSVCIKLDTITRYF